MKTVEEFVKEINGSEKLQKELAEINDEASLKDFLKKNGCEVSVAEFAKHLKASGEGEIGDDVASEVTGGGCIIGCPFLWEKDEEGRWYKRYIE